MKQVFRKNLSVEKIVHHDVKKEGKVHKFSRKYPAYFILILSLLASYIGFLSFKSNVETQRRLEFNKAVQSILTRFSNLKETELGILSSMRGLYDILPQVTKDYFEIYGTVPLETYKSIQSISYIIPLKKDKIESYLFDQYAIGYYYYEINPPGERDSYYLVQMMVPFANYDEKLLGYDIKTNESLREGFEKAKETGNLVCTDFLKFPIHNNNLTTFIFSPVYHKSELHSSEKNGDFLGLLALEINVPEFFKEALQGGSKVNNATFPSDSTVCFNIFEKLADKKINVFSSKNINKNSLKENSEFTSVETFVLADKTLEIEFYSSSFIGGKQQALLPWFVLILSLVLSFLLFAFILSVISTRAKIIEFAKKLSLSQQSILDHTQEFIVSVTLEGKFKTINNVFQKFFQIPDDYSNLTFFEFINDDVQKSDLINIIQNPHNHTTLEKRIKMSKPDGTHTTLNWTIIFFDDEHQINLIGRFG